MSNVDFQQGLAEMRALAAQAAGGSKPEAVGKGGEFAGMLKQAVADVNNQQAEAGRLADAFASGENVPLTDVMVAMQKSKVSFEAVKQVRNHLLEAYREISRMSI